MNRRKNSTHKAARHARRTADVIEWPRRSLRSTAQVPPGGLDEGEREKLRMAIEADGSRSKNAFERLVKAGCHPTWLLIKLFYWYWGPENVLHVLADETAKTAKLRMEMDRLKKYSANLARKADEFDDRHNRSAVFAASALLSRGVRDVSLLLPGPKPREKDLRASASCDLVAWVRRSSNQQFTGTVATLLGTVAKHYNALTGLAVAPPDKSSLEQALRRRRS